MDKILALFLSFVPNANANAQVVQNDAHSYAMSVAVGQVVNCDRNALQASLEGAGLYTKDEKGRYVLNVTKINDEYAYVLKDKQNNKAIKFDVESEVQSSVGTSNIAGIQKISEIKDKASFNEAVETIKSLDWYREARQ